MPNGHTIRRAGAAALLVPLAALTACASGRAAHAPPAPPTARAAQADTSSVDIGEVKTLETLFAGRFPGVTVSEGSGGGLQIRIRGGANTFYGGHEPLYILDGSPLPQGSGGIVFVNPYDIAKIEVLKNPADIGVYGLRGSNGVIRITTVRPAGR